MTRASHIERGIRTAAAIGILGLGAAACQPVEVTPTPFPRLTKPLQIIPGPSTYPPAIFFDYGQMPKLFFNVEYEACRAKWYFDSPEGPAILNIPKVLTIDSDGKRWQVTSGQENLVKSKAQSFGSTTYDVLHSRIYRMSVSNQYYNLGIRFFFLANCRI